MSMYSLNSLLDKALSVANVAGKKTEEVVESSKLKLQEVSIDAQIADCYEQIGSLVYRSRKADVDNEEEIAKLMSQVDELLEQLSQVQCKRAELRKVKKCPNCGAGCDVDSHFCSRCGMMLTPEEQPCEPPVCTPQEPQPEATEPEATEQEDQTIEQNL